MKLGNLCRKLLFFRTTVRYLVKNKQECIYNVYITHITGVLTFFPHTDPEALLQTAVLTLITVVLINLTLSV